MSLLGLLRGQGKVVDHRCFRKYKLGGEAAVISIMHVCLHFQPETISSLWAQNKPSCSGGRGGGPSRGLGMLGDIMTEEQGGCRVLLRGWQESSPPQVPEPRAGRTIASWAWRAPGWPALPTGYFHRYGAWGRKGVRGRSATETQTSTSLSSSFYTAVPLPLLKDPKMAMIVVVAVLGLMMTVSSKYPLTSV